MRTTAKRRRYIDNISDNVLIYDGQPIFCKHVSFSMEDLDLQGYFYHDVRRESDERADLHRNIMDRRKRIEVLHVRKGIQKIIESIAGPYMRYITYRIEKRIISYCPSYILPDLSYCHLSYDKTIPYIH